MADASTLCVKKIPDNLYELCLTSLVNYLQKSKCERNDLRSLPDSILMDVYYKMLQEKRLCILGAELSELDIFERLLRFSGAQLRLLQCFQAVIEHGSKLSAELATGYLSRCDANARSEECLIQLGLRLGQYLSLGLTWNVADDTEVTETKLATSREDSTRREDKLIELGLRLGGFLNEAGWYADAQRVLLRCRALCRAQPPSAHYTRLTLECCHRLLNTQSAYCCFPAAAETYALALDLLSLTDDAPAQAARPDTPRHVSEECSRRLDTCDILSQVPGLTDPHEPASEWALSALLARLFKEFSALFFVRCDYSAAHAWAMRALRLLRPDTPAKITIEVLRACGKACVVKRRFGQAGLLVRQAVALARQAFGATHPRYAAALLDYGFYLLNIDSIPHSVAVYEEALATLRRVFGRSSLHVATAQEDLAYALYVLEYSSGRFYKARDHAERAIRIIETLVPTDHLLLASAKRVKALILEEIALDTPAPHHELRGQNEPSLLEESEALHKAALQLSMMAFGEKNVQTAKHYGNLGRLYQSMHKFQDAETMHLKAIAIKEELLGAEDYEVGLSIGHLASLYNYHMQQHRAAEALYLRSIAISLKLFGSRYSGLEYDYRGLVHVFTQLKRHDRADHYSALLQHWHELREQSKTEQQPDAGAEQLLPLAELRARLFAPND
ncbi:amyloid protein-binding protein 2 isoform X2 [Cydia pomonella]|uniref:amyloid protein-binding protein 2 isoform X2 n=1 Tax=Cydia pomonella TaxID=82600 RepID=UPI002ADDB9BF|nr:amyloid protein-binding protein 2 isoform X2 [Cydia pomonella]